MSLQTLNLTPVLYEYLLNNSLREPPILRELREETKKEAYAPMQISPEQGQLMALLVRLLSAKKTLDIGTFTGYSALCVALAMEKGEVFTCDVNETTTQIAKGFFQKADTTSTIQIRLNPAIDTLKNLLAEGHAGTFDFIFIDADKANYLTYYQLGFDLLRKGGIIAIDNVLWDGKVADANQQDKTTVAIRELNTYLLHDSRIMLSLIPIGDGLTLAMKN